MAPQTTLVSADSHVIEPPHVWQDYIEPEFRERAPRLIGGETEDAWYIDGQLVSQIGIMSAAGTRYEDPSLLNQKGRWGAVPKRAYDPAEYAKATEEDGVSAAVLYPTYGLFFYNVDDVRFANAIFRAYNRWLAEFCEVSPVQLKGVAMLLLSDVEEAIRELRWAKKRGMIGAMIPVLPGPEMLYDDPRLEPFWQVAEELEMPLSLHIATYRPGSGNLTPNSDRNVSTGNPFSMAAVRSTTDMWVRRSIATMIFSGVFERHPRLKVIAVEFEMGWIPHFLRQMDFTYRERSFWAPVRFADGRVPSDIWHSNCLATFMEDSIGVKLRDAIGVDNIMWGSDFPHSESTWPNSRQVLETVLADVPPGDQRKMTYDTASKLYGF